MRADMNKVLCERQRGGDRSYMGSRKGYEKEFRFRGEDAQEPHADLDCLPRVESMTKRLGWEKRSFGENLGCLKGWVRSLEGKPWDKAYSDLCKVCPPSGTNTQRHAHQHLDQYIERRTVILDNGKIGYNSGTSNRRYYERALYEPITESTCDFYVHPVTKCVMKNRRKKGFKYRPSRRDKTRSKLVVKLSEQEILGRLHGIWYHFDLEEPHFRPASSLFGPSLLPLNPDQFLPALAKDPSLPENWTPHPSWYGTKRTLHAVRKRQLSSRELRDHGVENERLTA